MGLDTTHDCWHGPYSSFGEWRSALFDAAVGGGPRKTYDYINEIDTLMPVSDPLYSFLNHSDCDGMLPVETLEPLACRLQELLPKLTGYHLDRAERFIAGLKVAAALGEPVEFH